MLRLTIEQARAMGLKIEPIGKKLSTYARPLKRSIKREIEGEEQSQLVAWFECSYPELSHLLIHIPNGGSRKNAYEGWRLKKQGVKRGVSDLLLAYPNNGYAGLWIEFKATPPNNAMPTKEQLFWLEEMRRVGYAAFLCLGVAEAQNVIETYLAG